MTDYSKVPLIDDAQFKLIFEEDSAEILQELADLFKEESDPRIRKLLEAAGKGNSEVVRMQAHAIAGSSGNLGALRLSESSRAMEKAAQNEDMEQCLALAPQVKAAYDETNAFLQKQVASMRSPS